MLTEHLAENLPLLASCSLNPSRAYCMFLGVSCQSSMQHPAANPNLPLTLSALPDFENRVGSLCHHLYPHQKWGFCFAKVLPGMLGCIQQLDWAQPCSAKATQSTAGVPTWLPAKPHTTACLRTFHFAGALQLSSPSKRFPAISAESENASTRAAASPRGNALLGNNYREFKQGRAVAKLLHSQAPGQQGKTQSCLLAL